MLFRSPGCPVADRRVIFGRSLTSETPRRSAATPSTRGDCAGNRTGKRTSTTRWNANLHHGERTRHNFRSGQTLRARHRQRWPTMVEHREKRCSNASSRGIKSDRSTIQFSRVTQPVSKVGRGRQPAHLGGCRSARRRQTGGNLAGASQDVPGGPSRDPSTGVERRLGPRPRASKAPQNAQRCSFTTAAMSAWNLLHRGCNPRLTAEVAANPSPPWPAEGSPTERLDRERRRSGGGTERSSFTSGLEPERSTRAAANEQGFRFAGMPAHSVRDASTSGAIPRSKDLEGGQSPVRIGR